MNAMAGKTLSVAATARRMQCTLKYVYDRIYEGRLDATKVNGKWRISAAAVEAWRNGTRREGEYSTR